VTPSPRFEIVLAAQSLVYSRFRMDPETMLLPVESYVRRKQVAAKLTLLHLSLTWSSLVKPDVVSRRGLGMHSWRRLLFGGRGPAVTIPAAILL